MHADRFSRTSGIGSGKSSGHFGARTERSTSERVRFISLNLLLLPLVLLIYVTVNAEGLVIFQPIFGMPLYRAPGLDFLEQFAFWNSLRLSHVTAAGLLILLNAVWFWIVKHVRGVGGAAVERTFGREFFLFKATLAAVSISVEAAIFFAGLVAVGGGLWGGGSWLTAGLLTLLYLAGMIWIAIWHNEFAYGGPKV